MSTISIQVNPEVCMGAAMQFLLYSSTLVPLFGLIELHPQLASPALCLRSHLDVQRSTLPECVGWRSSAKANYANHHPWYLLTTQWCHFLFLFFLTFFIGTIRVSDI